MVTNDSKINNARVMTMFMAIRNFELKNVRTLQYDSKDMVKRELRTISSNRPIMLLRIQRRQMSNEI